MKILIDKDIVGELTDDGEIITNDIWLKKLADKIKHQELTDLRSRKTKHGLYGYLVTVKKGDPGYVSAMANILLDNGYGLRGYTTYISANEAAPKCSDTPEE